LAWPTEGRLVFREGVKIYINLGKLNSGEMEEGMYPKDKDPKKNKFSYSSLINNIKKNFNKIKNSKSKIL